MTVPPHCFKAFQFLIGRLDTPDLKFLTEEQKKFQFLIGRLDTYQWRPESPEKQLFQFLIGRLDTGILKAKRNTVTTSFNSS